MIIDTHSHVQFPAFKDDRDEIIKKTLADDIWMINVGTKFQTSKDAVLLAEKYDTGVYAAIGLHPMHAAAEFMKIKHDASEEPELVLPARNASPARQPGGLGGGHSDAGGETEFDKEKYRELAKSKKVVAIGEIGLDYYYKPKTAAKLTQFKEKQKQVFLQQLDLAQELGLPVILHCRMAHDDVIEILSDYSLLTTHYKLAGVIHCFTGTLEQAQKYVALGFHIGINGIIFKFNIDEVIKNTPLESILVETDCPYLTPAPAAALGKTGPEGFVRNEPLFIKHSIQKIADLKGISFEQVGEKTTQNARVLFNI